MSIIQQILNWRPGNISGYRLLGKIAEGGMSTVYKATSSAAHEIIAIKVLFPRYSRHKQKLKKIFMEKQVEGEMAISLNHPNIIRTYSYGKKIKYYYFIMEYINGLNLKDMIYQRRALLKKRRLDIMKQVAQGLNYLHTCGIIHRDMCPKNILIPDEGNVKIIDFGLSISRSSKYKGLGERSGTPSYMAPEQIRALEADVRTDIYSFGVTMYEMLAGKQPFDGADDYARMQQHLTAEPVPLNKVVSDIPPALVEIVSRAMQKDPADRYKSIRELLYALEKVHFDGS